MKSVQRLVGHRSAAMTLDVYSGLFEDDLDTVAERLHEAHVYPMCTQAIQTSGSISDTTL